MEPARSGRITKTEEAEAQRERKQKGWVTYSGEKDGWRCLSRLGAGSEKEKDGGEAEAEVEAKENQMGRA